MTSREQLLWKSIPDNNMFVPIDAMKVVFSRINFQGDCNDIDHNMDNINNDNDHEEGNDDKLFGQHINNCHHQPTILTYLTPFQSHLRHHQDIDDIISFLKMYV